MSDEPVFARAHEAEAPELARLAAATLPEAWSEAGFRSQLGRPESRIWLARLAVEPVGFLAAHRVLDELQVLSLGVTALHRRRGVGRGLVQAAIGSEPGLGEVHLEVRSNDPVALAFYRRLGFRQLGRRRDFYEAGVDALLLRLAAASPGDPSTPLGG